MQINNLRFKLLLKNLGVSAKMLSMAIHVDNSLVLKWKNGNRKLTINSIHFNNIIDYIFNINRNTILTQMKKLLIISDNEVISNEDEYKKLLINWLTDPTESSTFNLSENSSSYSAMYTVYIGNKGKRDAITRLLDLALSLPEGQILHILSYEDLSWLIEDIDFYKSYIDKITKLVEKNCVINIIRVIGSYYQELLHLESNLFFKYPDNINNFYLPTYSGILVNNSLHVLENHAMISSFSYKNVQSSYNFFTDPYNIQLHTNVYKTLVSKSKNLLTPYSLDMLDILTRRTKQTLLRYQNSIHIYDCALSMFTLPGELLIEILNENGISTNVAKKIYTIYEHLSCFGNEFSTKILYAQTILDTVISLNQIYIHDLSILLGKPIYMSDIQFKKYLKNILKALNDYKGFEIGIVPADLPIYAENINITVIENSAIFLSDAENISFPGVLIQEPVYINAYYNIYQDVWNSIPSIYREKEQVTKILDHLILTL